MIFLTASQHCKTVPALVGYRRNLCFCHDETVLKQLANLCSSAARRTRSLRYLELPKVAGISTAYIEVSSFCRKAKGGKQEALHMANPKPAAWTSSPFTPEGLCSQQTFLKSKSKGKGRALLSQFVLHRLCTGR